jgi:hypothetical protein
VLAPRVSTGRSSCQRPSACEGPTDGLMARQMDRRSIVSLGFDHLSYSAGDESATVRVSIAVAGLWEEPAGVRGTQTIAALSLSSGHL